MDSEKRNKIYKLFIIIMFIGSLLGALFINLCSDNYIFCINLLNINGVYLNESNVDKCFSIIYFLSNYVFTILIVWLIGFSKFGVYINLFLIWYKAFMFSLILSILYMFYNSVGLEIFLIVYFIPVLIFIFILLNVSYFSIQKSISNYNYFSKFKDKFIDLSLKRYIREFIISIMGLVVIRILQCTILTILIQKLLL